MNDLNWRHTMMEEMVPLHSENICDIVSLPPYKTIVECRWVYTLKVGLGDQIDRFKACLVAKGYT